MEQFSPETVSLALSRSSSDTLHRQTLEAKAGAARLLGCYRCGDAHDPETFISAVAAVLARYPIHIIRQVTDPAAGIPSKIQWIPSIKEISDACKAAAAPPPRSYAEEWDERSRLQLEERKLLEDHRPRKTYEQIKKELAASGIFIGGRKRLQSHDEEHAFRSKYGITSAQWDAIPDSKLLPPDERG